jgi:putative ABC transport system permease protein
MRTLAVRSIRSNPTRFVATVLAVVVSTGFLAGTLVLRDSLGASLKATTRSQLEGVDAAVTNAGALATDPTGGSGGAGGSTVPGPEPAGPPSTRRSDSNTPTGESVAGQPRQLGVNRNVPASLLPTVQQAEGVKDAAGILSGVLSVLRDDGSSVAENVPGSAWIAAPELNLYTLVEGRAPERSGEVVIDARTAEEGGFAIGAPIQLATSQGPRPATLVGVVKFGDQDNSGRGDVLVTEADAFTWFAGGRQEYSAIYANAGPGVGEAAVVRSIEAAVGPGYRVDPGEQLREESTSGIDTIVNVVGWALVAFAFVALVVALFTIYNTFSIVVHQRTREFGLLRAVGASDQQVTRSVRVEALILGFVSSVIGFLLGIVMFVLLTRLIPQFEDIAGTVTMRITVPSVLIVLLLGTGVTVMSSVIPAWRAGRTRPVEVLRSVAIDRSATSRPRAIIGLSLLVIGISLLLAGAVTQRFLVMVIGPPLLFLGVLIGGPVLAGAFGALIERIVAPFRRASLRLGAENVRRNPSRSAATALALVIGVFLVVLVTAGGGAVRDYAVTQLSQLGGPDVTVFSFGGELNRDYVNKVRGAAGVKDTAEVYLNIAELGGSSELQGFPVSAVGYDDVGGLGLTYVEGSPDRLGPNDVIMPTIVTQNMAVAIGDPVRVEFANGESRDLRVGAIARPGIPPAIFMSADAAREADPALVPIALQVVADSGQVQAVTDSVTALSRQYAGLDVQPGNFIAQLVKGLFNFVIAAANGLLGVAVVIALFGIVNTLVLSVNERTREIGLLRAVGMTRRQVGRTIRLEAVAVSFLGASIGTAFGLFVAWCLTRPILNQEGEVATGFSWPVTQLLIILVLALIVGVLASVPPVRRASRLNIIEAVTVD